MPNHEPRNFEPSTQNPEPGTDKYQFVSLPPARTLVRIQAERQLAHDLVR